MPRHLCRIDELPDGGARGFDPHGDGRDTIFVVRRGERLHGWRNACPHVDGAPMAWRKDAYLSADRSHIVCHAHGARFEIDTGRCVLGPCEGATLTRVELQVTNRGEVVLAANETEETPR